MAEWIVVHPGVTMAETSGWGNIYRGDADALIAAGIVLPHQVPGRTTSGKVMASFMPDGSRVRQGSNTERLEGHLSIKKVSRTKFDVAIMQSSEEMQRRRAVAKAFWAEKDRVLRERKAQQPAQPGPRQRGHLRLVWSATA